LGGADQAAGRGLVHFQSFITEITFYRNFQIIVKLHGPEGAGSDAFPAADTFFGFDKDDAPVIPFDGLHRAGLLAGGLGAVMTVDGDEEGAFFNHPDKPGADPQVMLLLAGHLAGMATDAVFFKNGKGYFFHDPAS
jgi:hypothetical protein